MVVFALKSGQIPCSAVDLKTALSYVVLLEKNT